MRLHRFIGNYDLAEKNLTIADEELYNQLKNVFRMKPGDEIILADGKLNEGLAKITGLAKGAVEVAVSSVAKNENESKTDATLYCAILKKENFEFVVEKCTEAGIKEIVPVIAKHTVKKEIRRDRLEKIIKEAAEQSGRGVVPRLGEVMSFEEAAKAAGDNDVNIIFQKSATMFKQARFAANHPRRVGIFVGPEGGWDESEIELATRRDFKFLSLGLLTLRAETAAVVASWLIENT